MTDSFVWLDLAAFRALAPRAAAPAVAQAGSTLPFPPSPCPCPCPSPRVLAFFLAFSGGCLVLAGLAFMQNLCHTDGCGASAAALRV